MDDAVALVLWIMCKYCTTRHWLKGLRDGDVERLMHRFCVEPQLTFAFS